MLKHHYLDVELKSAGGSIAYFARAPRGCAVIFVHGFTGHRTETWDQMHHLLISEASLEGVDVVFYSYESTKGQALSNANLLRQFISDFASGRFNKYAPNKRKPHHENYSKIVVVAHSLGAALARRAHLDAYKLGETWAGIARLVLFGPAHCGAFLARLGFELGATARILSCVAVFVGYKIPVLRDLDPKSEFVASLRADTLEQLIKNPDAPLKAEAVIFGALDKVALMENFCHDPPSTAWRDHGHSSVCRATEAFRAPLEEVLARL